MAKSHWTMGKMLLAVRAAQLSEALARHALNPNNPTWFTIRIKIAELREAALKADEEAPDG